MSAVKRKPRRHVTYTPALGRAICKMLASGMTLKQVCRRPHMPHERAVRFWAMDPDHPFSPLYARAREVGYLAMADIITEIADQADPEFPGAAKLQVDTRKWLLSKALPKIYGDKNETVHKLDATDAFVNMLRMVSEGRAPKLIDVEPA